MTSGFFTGNVLRGLAVRVLLFLSLALLPIGLLAVVQTRNISEQSQSSAELSLLAVTERFSAAEQRLLQEAFGTAEALGAIVRQRRNNDEECSAILREYREAAGIYAIVGFVAKNGQMRCSSAPDVHDFGGHSTFSEAIAAHTRRAFPMTSENAETGPSTVVTVPIHEQEESVGVMAISIPFHQFSPVDEPQDTLMPLTMLSLNQNGDILSTEGDLPTAMGELPADLELAALVGEESRVFYALNQQGRERAYAVVPIVPGTAYALSVWPIDTPFLTADIASRLNAVVPIAMWVASLIVAFLALDRLAIKHIRKLGRQMRRFALNRTMPRVTLAPSVPTELVEMESAFLDMAESILRDEAMQEDNLRQKNILLKEVHHRVKNNLQLISSIMNMQIRQASNAESKFALQRLQERLLSLALVHENLYKDDYLTRVEASTLLREIVDQLLTVGLAAGTNVEVKQHYDQISLDPDDAAPLTLLTAEAVTNALKYVAQPVSDGAFINIRLTQDAPERATLSIENTVGSHPEASSTGLGARLITAFARQLNGQVEASEADGIYQMTFSFPVPLHGKPVKDY